MIRPGGGPPELLELSDHEKAIYEIITPTSISGNENVSESSVNFFSGIDQEETEAYILGYSSSDLPVPRQQSSYEFGKVQIGITGEEDNFFRN